ncbi:hypothetical protein BLNAU_15980 [Blattamonas nauphoetae]|uniref:PH domain-containing protein n=1 Tax=Blattamonas nauphoetae TaxID=2049346 RepID=A0ABQ9XCM1_9EUKA|nr:hypothetical protein BLNAU_15980 [Blattamonas nauphoetae]
MNKKHADRSRFILYEAENFSGFHCFRSESSQQHEWMSNVNKQRDDGLRNDQPVLRQVQCRKQFSRLFLLHHPGIVFMEASQFIPHLLLSHLQSEVTIRHGQPDLSLKDFGVPELFTSTKLTGMTFSSVSVFSVEIPGQLNELITLLIALHVKFIQHSPDSPEIVFSPLFITLR